MAQIFQAGAVNLAALVVPDVYVQILPPQSATIAGVPTNVSGIVGAASWGPVNSPTVVGNPSQLQQSFYLPVNRKYDLVTAASIQFLQGASNLRLVRVTDGTDTAATGAMKDTTTPTAVTGATLTAIYTGSSGNLLQAQAYTGSQANSTKVVVSFPGQTPETFDNITAGLASLTPAAGTGYTSVPVIGMTAPTAPNGVQATATASLLVVSDTVAAGGTGYAINDTITLSNGVVLKVTAVTTGAVTTATVQTAGSLTTGAVPTNPVAQVSSSGAGTGATFNLVWGIGPATITNAGSGYTGAAPTATLTGGGAGTGGGYTAATNVWVNIVSAINSGNSATRGPSKLVVASIGTASNPPQTTTATAFLSGTDGAAGVVGTTLVGTDGNINSRKGMYALRNSGCAVAMLADCDDSTTWTTQVSYGLSEQTYMILTGPAGQTPTTAATAKSTAGIDSYQASLMLGDWIYWNDPVNQVLRLISPQAFKAGCLANLSPQFPALNQRVYGVVGTQTSYANQTYSNADLQVLGQAGIDVICNPIPAGSTFGVRFGRNTSSGGAAINSDAYTRMTNFLATSVAANLGQYVGKLQSIQPTDPLRTQISGNGNAWLQGLATQVPAMIDSGTWQCDLNNNSVAGINAGNCVSNVNVKYLSVATNIIANLLGGQTVQVQSITSIPKT